MRTVHMTFVSEDSDRGYGDWLKGRSEADDELVAEIYRGLLPVSEEEIGDFLMCAIETDVIVSIEP